MFAMDAGKPRKLTTYGKAGRQQTFGFNKFLETSPEKRKSQSSTDGLQSSGPLKATSVSQSKTPDLAWDVPSDQDEPKHRAQPSKWHHATTTVKQKLKPAATSVGRVKEKVSMTGRGRETMKSSEEVAQRKRKREESAIVRASATRDVFDFPDDDDGVAAAPLLLPTRSRGKTPVTATTISTATPSRIKGSRNTPEPQATHRTPVTARKTEHISDIYDIPDDNEVEMKTKPRLNGMTGSPPPARKRQRTPAADARTDTKVAARERKRATTPVRNRGAMLSDPASTRRKMIASPKPNTNKGVVKRKFGKGSSAPASLFSMIREPPSPLADSSDSVTSPATPDLSFEMEIEPEATPTTPPNQRSASPAALPGSVTPRQKQLWSQLLGDESTDGPSELPMSKLQLASTVKPAHKLASLARSTSDIPQGFNSRRTRLIDTLKATAPISEADEMDVEEPLEQRNEESSSNASPEVSGPKPPRLRSEVSFKNASAKVTYGQGRTYLEEKNEERLWDMLAAEEPSQGFSYTGSQSQGLAEDDMDIDGGSQLRAAHDLRVAGSRKRLHDELSMLVMDVEEKTNSIAIRRSALRDLAAKLTDKEAASCFIETGLDRAFLKAVEKDTDTVFLFLEAAVVVLLGAADPTSSILDHIFHSQMFSNIFKLLELNMSLEKIVRDRRSNLAKMTQTMVLEFRDLMFASDVWGQTKPLSVSPRILGLQCIEMVVRKLREHGSSYALLDETTVKKILEIAHMELTEANADMAVVELALSALQVNTVSTPTLRHKIWPPKLTQAFADLIPGLFELGNASASLCVHLALKLAVELTNHNRVACDIIGTPAIIDSLLNNANKSYASLLNHQVGDAYHVAFDFTVLSFGLTINLTEVSDNARLAMLEGKDQSLKEAIRLFIRAKKHAEDAESLEDTQMNVIYGCLAFTLGNLSRNPVLRKMVASQLPGGNLSMVLDAMHEFAAINQLTDKKEFEGEEGHETSKSFTERLQTVLAEVKAVNM